MLFLCAIVGVMCSLFLVTVEGTNGGMLSRVQDAPTCMPRPLAEQDADLPLNNQLWRGPTLSWNNYDQTTCYACLAPKERLPSVLPLSRAWSRQEKDRRIFQTTLQVKAQLKRNWIVACRGDAAPQSSCLGVRLR
jgi:hypothetical protein